MEGEKEEEEEEEKEGRQAVFLELWKKVLKKNRSSFLLVFDTATRP